MSRRSLYDDCRAILGAVIVALAISAGQAAAQGGESGGGGGGERMQAALFNGITLTDAQHAKIDSIAAAYRASMGSVTPGPNMSPDDRQKLRESRRHEVADFRGVLTPDQQPQFDKNVAAVRSQMRQRAGQQPQQ